MKLEIYKDAVNLDTPWHVPEEKVDSLDWIILEVLRDKALAEYVVGNPVPDSEADKRAWLKAMLTVRMPGHENAPLFRAIDTLLANENKQYQIQKANLIPALPIAEKLNAQLSIWQGDITKLKADAIVNAANSQMLGCFQPFHACIDNAIHCAAGPRLREDCNTIMSLQGKDEATGEAKITRAYNLPSRFVLHTVGPIIPSGSQLTAADESALAQCYRSCLSLAAETDEIRSVAFCGISTGIFGFPKQEAAAIAVNTVIGWLRENTSAIDQIIFNTFDLESTSIYQRELAKWA